MLMNDYIHIIQSDEGKYVVIYLKPSESISPIPLSHPDIEDEPIEFYHLNGFPLVTVFAFHTIMPGYKRITKVFTDFQKVIEHLSTIGIMQ